jgi:hypothetical protein
VTPVWLHAVPGVGVEELVAAQEAIHDRTDTTDVVRSFGGVETVL